MKAKLTLEDATMMYNRWVSGIAAREFNAQRVKFKDLAGQNFDTSQSPNKAKASNVLPYQLTNAASILGELFTNTSNAINAFEGALTNPVVKKDEKAQVEISAIVSHLNNSLEELKKIITVVTKNG